jgi:cytochrome c biogenesis protein CcmG, thiol:disulfide interchange protein DsbE
VNEAAGLDWQSPRELKRLANREPNVRIVPTERMSTRLRRLLALSLLALTALLYSGCGSSGDEGASGSHPNYAKALAGAPAPLTALYKQGNQLLPGGSEAYEKRIEQLRGYPIVVNVWASWCGPCRVEFPALQELSARYGEKVAFIGVNSQDSEDAAATFLREEPVPYPSYSDPDKEVTDSIGARYLPSTAFYDESGELVNVKLGQYAEEADLEADIRHYALDGA